MLLLPNYVTQVLTRLKRGGFPEAVVAGGYLRDVDNGREPKDVDIFVRSSLGDTKGAIEEAVGYLGRTLIANEARDYVGDLDYVDAIYDFTIPPSMTTEREMLPLQIVTLDIDAPLTPEKVYKRIDFGICQIAHTGQSLYYSQAYLRDKERQSFTLQRCESESQFDRSFRRYLRLQEKYPGWTLRVPDRFWSFGERVRAEYGAAVMKRVQD